MFRPQLPCRHSQDRSAFTLVEIMVSIVILAILMSLLLPAIQRVRTTARIQEVKSDMEKLSAGLTQFKTRFGVDVPGSISFCETGTLWTSTPETQRSRAVIRQIWPQYSFTQNVDINGDGTNSAQPIELDGADCLVFFLGGLRDSTSGALVGFSKNPQNPFGPTSGNREGPFYEFNPGRLIDIDSDGIQEYRDPIPGQSSPYLYFANGYRVRQDTTATTVWVNADNWGTTANQQRMIRAYYQPNINVTWPGGPAQSVPHNKSTFQLISPGFDYQYGNGGAFNAQDNSGLTSDDDRDNITNFHSGLLGG